jgi:acyl-coenzyme A thioesterase PaaI-like protein
MRPVQIGQAVLATGSVIHHGRRTAVGECRLDVDGDLVGTASASFIVYLPEKD